MDAAFGLEAGVGPKAVQFPEQQNPAGEGKPPSSLRWGPGVGGRRRLGRGRIGLLFADATASVYSPSPVGNCRRNTI